MPSTDYDVIIIGAGHNGLTAAAYLAKAGLRVLSLERRSVLGGATLTDEIFPGYRLPRYSYAALLLEGKVVQDLDLESHGLKVLPVDPERIHPFPDGRAVESGTTTPRSPRKSPASRPLTPTPTTNGLTSG